MAFCPYCKCLTMVSLKDIVDSHWLLPLVGTSVDKHASAVSAIISF